MLEAAGSSFENVLKVNIFLTTMEDFTAMNEAYDEFFRQEVKPVSKPLARQVAYLGV